ncbi:MAG: type I-C CRISPR-associated protein Cas8c/Csd1 [Nitrospinaceae bacterium]
MILQSLYHYYHRKAEDPDGGLAPPGFEWKEIHFVLVLDGEGGFVDLEDRREPDGKKLKAAPALVPKGVKKSVNIASNLLWGGLDYVLGEDVKSKPENKPEVVKRNSDRARKAHQNFLELLHHLEALTQEDPGVLAVLHFLETGDKTRLQSHPLWAELKETAPNLTFRLVSENLLVCQRPAVLEAVRDEAAGSTEPKGFCLVSGEKDIIERLHPAIKGVRGAQTVGANIVSFNLGSFTSFEKKQGDNAPVGKQAAFAYTTALNHLLGKASRQRLQVGDATAVFWAAEQHDFESGFHDLFDEPPKDDPDRLTAAVRGLYRSPATGAPSVADDRTRFYVLGLSPNAARLSVRFWYEASIEEMAGNIRRHFEDTAIVHRAKEPGHLPLWRLLKSTAIQEETKNIQPKLAGEVMHRILSGGLYPRALLQAVIGRIHAEQGHISYPRAALLKACLNRMIRMHQPQTKEVTVALDATNTHTAYRIGRLFAALEKLQEEALPGINTTIRDRYYGAVSSTPARVLPTLLKLKNHHLGKLEHPGRKVNFEKLLAEILLEVTEFPKVFSLEDQGRFALGYYHQRHQFFQKSDSDKKGD